MKVGHQLKPNSLSQGRSASPPSLSIPSLHLRFARLVAGLLFVTGPIRKTTREKRRCVIAAVHSEARQNFTQPIELRDGALSRIIHIYSGWDDTFRFVTERDLAWAQVYLDGVLPFQEFPALWI